MKYENEALKVIHENAKNKYKIGLISETRMREYDELCLTEKSSSPAFTDDDSSNINQVSRVTA